MGDRDVLVQTRLEPDEAQALTRFAESRGVSIAASLRMAVSGVLGFQYVSVWDVNVLSSGGRYEEILNGLPPIGALRVSTWTHNKMIGVLHLRDGDSLKPNPVESVDDLLGWGAGVNMRGGKVLFDTLHAGFFTKSGPRSGTVWTAENVVIASESFAASAKSVATFFLTPGKHTHWHPKK